MRVTGWGATQRRCVRPIDQRRGIAHRYAVWHPVLLIATLLLAGCGGGYRLKGKVVEGPVAMVEVVDADDPRYVEQDRSAGGAVVWAVFEPNNGIDRERLGRFVTDGEGRFEVPIDAVGAGLLMYEVELLARRTGHQGAMGVVPLPGRGGAVLITLPRGVDTLRPEEDYLDQTLRDAEPYLGGDR